MYLNGGAVGIVPETFTICKVSENEQYSSSGEDYITPVFTLKPGTKIIEKTETYGDDDNSFTETYYELSL